MRVRKNILRVIGQGAAVVALLLVIAVSGTMLWVATGPRDLNLLTPYLEAALLPQDESFRVDIERTSLHWDGWANPVGLHAHNVRVILPEGQTQAVLPEVVLGVEFSSVLLGMVQVEAVTIDRPEIRLYRTANGEIGFGIGEEGGAPPPRIGSIGGSGDAALLPGEGLTSETLSAMLMGLRRIEITNAKLALHHQASGAVFASPRSDIRLVHNDKGVLLELSMAVVQPQEDAQLQARAVMEFASGNIGVSGAFSAVQPSLLAPFLPDNPWFERVLLPVGGAVEAVISPQGEVLGGRFELTGDNGAFHYPEFFPEDFSVKALALKGEFTQGFAAVTLSEGRLDIDAQNITFRGGWKVTEQGPHITLQGRAENLPVRELYRYWPIVMAPESRDWVMHAVRGGQAEGELTLDIKPGMLELPALPSEALQARVSVNGGTVRYLPEHRLVKNIDAVVDFTADSMQVAVTRATFMSGVVADKVIVEIPDFNADALMLHAAFDMRAPGREVAAFLTRPEFEFSKPLQLTPAQMTGTVSGTVKLGVLLYELLEDGTEREGDLRDYAVEATLHDIVQPGLFGKYDITAGNGALRVNGEGLSFAGKAAVQGAPAVVQLDSDFMQSKTTAQVDFSSITLAQLQALGYPVPAQLEGGMKLGVQLEDTKQATVTNIAADVTSIALMVPEVGISKPAGVAGNLTLKAREDAKSGKTQIEHFAFNTAGALAQGKASLDRQGALQRLEVTRFKAGNNNLAAVYEKHGAMHQVTVRGRALDLSALAGEKQEGFSQSLFDNQKVDLRLAEIILGPQRVAYAVNARWHCDHLRCYDAYASGSTPARKSFLLRIAAQGPKRKLTLTSEDAGDFLRMLDIIDTIKHGKLVVEAAFDDQQPGKPLSGRVTIRDYALQDAPVLTKILRVASLTGILDILTGKGVSFTKLSIPFTLVNDVVKVKDAKAYGGAVGVTASGKLHLARSEVDMKGVLVPAYSVNSVLGNIPIIGVIAGGDEGLFAVNYSVKGTYPDAAEVSVNPLSILAPGFLRGLFDAPTEE